MQQNFDPEDLLRVIAEQRITHLTMVPTMFVRLIRLERGRSRSIRRFIDPMGDAHRRGMSAGRQAPDDRVVGTGHSRDLWRDRNRSRCRLQYQEWLAHPGTVGRPMAGTEIKIYDEKPERKSRPAALGEIYLRTEAYSDFTYHGLPDQRAQVDRGGLVTCGDVGYLDHEGSSTSATASGTW